MQFYGFICFCLFVIRICATVRFVSLGDAWERIELLNNIMVHELFIDFENVLNRM